MTLTPFRGNIESFGARGRFDYHFIWNLPQFIHIIGKKWTSSLSPGALHPTWFHCLKSLYHSIPASEASIKLSQSHQAVFCPRVVKPEVSYGLPFLFPDKGLPCSSLPLGIRAIGIILISVANCHELSGLTAKFHFLLFWAQIRVAARPKSLYGFKGGSTMVFLLSSWSWTTSHVTTGLASVII